MSKGKVGLMAARTNIFMVVSGFSTLLSGTPAHCGGTLTFLFPDYVRVFTRGTGIGVNRNA
ncbi:hypothetical protein GCM10008110_19720 [Marinobacter persicus]|nr:hypothetical protein GCM10008110_19720 [Marinobacter persicus]